MKQINTLKGYENVKDMYYCDDKGYIYRKLKNDNFRPKKLTKHKHTGYLYVNLMLKDNKNGDFRVNRIIASAFIPNPQNKPTVNHINHKRDDNRAENLAWTTQLENTSGNDKWLQARGYFAKKVVIIDEKGNETLFNSIEECANYFNLKETTIIDLIEHGYKCDNYLLKYYQ